MIEQEKLSIFQARVICHRFFFFSFINMQFSDMQMTDSFGSRIEAGHVKNYAKEMYIFSFILYLFWNSFT